MLKVMQLVSSTSIMLRRVHSSMFKCYSPNISVTEDLFKQGLRRCKPDGDFQARRQWGVVLSKGCGHLPRENWAHGRKLWGSLSYFDRNLSRCTCKWMVPASCKHLKPFSSWFRHGQQLLLHLILSPKPQYQETWLCRVLHWDSLRPYCMFWISLACTYLHF